jgi:hypothetical protein
LFIIFVLNGCAGLTVFFFVLKKLCSFFFVVSRKFLIWFYSIFSCLQNFQIPSNCCKFFSFQTIIRRNILKTSNFCWLLVSNHSVIVWTKNEEWKKKTCWLVVFIYMLNFVFSFIFAMLCASAWESSVQRAGGFIALFTCQSICAASPISRSYKQLKFCLSCMLFTNKANQWWNIVIMSNYEICYKMRRAITKDCYFSSFFFQAILLFFFSFSIFFLFSSKQIILMDKCIIFINFLLLIKCNL